VLIGLRIAGTPHPPAPPQHRDPPAVGVGAAARGVAMSENAYGRMLCSARRGAGLTLRQVSAEIGIAVSYLHDVESGRRLPLDSRRTIALAKALRTDPMLLLVAAAKVRGVVEVHGDEGIIRRACELALEASR
jgi:hypothetical protein